MTVRHQHDIDVGQRLEGDARIVVALRPCPAHRRNSHRPHGIDQDVQPRRLDQPARMPHERQPHLVAGDTRRRPIGVWARRPVRPGGALPAATELPAHNRRQRFRRYAVGIVELKPVEMIGDRTLVGPAAGNPGRRQADEGRGAGKQSKETTAGDRHGRDTGPELARLLYGLAFERSNSATRSRFRRRKTRLITIS